MQKLWSGGGWCVVVVGVLLGLHCGVRMCCEVVMEETVGAESNNKNNTAITTDWTLPSFAKARFASPVVYPPVLRVRRASADCLLYYDLLRLCKVYALYIETSQPQERTGGICIMQRSNILLPAFTSCHPQTNILSLHKRQSRVSIEPCLTSYQQQPTFPATQRDHNTIRKH